MKIYNTLTNQLEPFATVEPHLLRMYVCGPTVYNYIHIGNARPVIFFDMVKRYFESIGYEVEYVSNITDVDDKIIQKALDSNETEEVIASRYLAAFLEDVKLLGSDMPDFMPKATHYIPSMIMYIQELINKGFAYQVDGDVYFRVKKLSKYGQLSNQNIDELESGSRILVNTKKEDPLDFTLWKKTEKGVNWDSPFGQGRPGWHTECVVMNDDIFKGVIDIHGGGSDLKFPHHENEIAQAEAHRNHAIANYWMHVGRLNMNDEKMSKSLGNVILVRDVLTRVNPNAFRLMILSMHYRLPINYTEELMGQFVLEYEKIERTYNQAFLLLDLVNGFVDAKDESTINQFHQWMEDDFNTPNVLTLMQDVVKKLNAAIRQKSQENTNMWLQTLKHMLFVFGIFIPKARLTEEERSLYIQWSDARDNKDFERADALRNQLVQKGIIQ